jgi:hypothetical protein
MNATPCEIDHGRNKSSSSQVRTRSPDASSSSRVRQSPSVAYFGSCTTRTFLYDGSTANGLG